MDDLLMILGALLLAIGVGMIFLPAGVIVFGLELGAAGYLEARRPKKQTP